MKPNRHRSIPLRHSTDISQARPDYERGAARRCPHRTRQKSPEVSGHRSGHMAAGVKYSIAAAIRDNMRARKKLHHSAAVGRIQIAGTASQSSILIVWVLQQPPDRDEEDAVEQFLTQHAGSVIETAQNLGVLTPLADAGGGPTARRWHGPVRASRSRRRFALSASNEHPLETSASAVERSFGGVAATAPYSW
jgi:hypothetical protein